MTRTLYDLAGADPALRFSPFCWRTRLALAHKGLAVETVPWRFEEPLPDGCRTVPVLQDGAQVIGDSWSIACYLEEHYPDRPSLFGGAGGQAHARFINAWTDRVLHPVVARLVALDIHDCLAPQNQAYFRESRERRFGTTLEAFQEGREMALLEARALLAPARAVLERQAWLGGTGPSYADYIVFGAFQWLRCVSRFEPLAADDPVSDWRRRIMELHGGLAGAATRA